MRFVYCGYDFILGAPRRLIRDGHTLAGVFTFPCDNIFNFNTETLAFAEKYGAPVSLQKPTAEDIAKLQPELVVAAGYLYKIPDVSPAYGINIHPSYLPKGRGLMPIPYILLDHPEAAGFTIHKLAQKLDSGDILYQQHLPLKPRETVESLSGLIAERAPEALSKIIFDLPGSWNSAKKQNEAASSTFPPPDNRMRLLDWTLPLERLDKIARAFGHYGSLAQIDGEIYAIYSHEIKKEAHTHKPGSVIAHDETITIAVDGGLFIAGLHERLQPEHAQTQGRSP